MELPYYFFCGSCYRANQGVMSLPCVMFLSLVVGILPINKKYTQHFVRYALERKVTLTHLQSLAVIFLVATTTSTKITFPFWCWAGIFYGSIHRTCYMVDFSWSLPGQNGCPFVDDIFKYNDILLFSWLQCILIKKKKSLKFFPQGIIDNKLALI